MDADLLSVILLGVITLALVFSRTNVAFVTFSLCAGYVLSNSVGQSLTEAITSNVDTGTIPIELIVRLVLLLTPPLIIWYRFRRTQKGGGRFIMQILPALGLALLFVILIFEQLPEGGQEILKGESFIHGQIKELRDWLVVYAILSAMFDVLTQHTGPKRPYKRRKNKD